MAGNIRERCWAYLLAQLDPHMASGCGPHPGAREEIDLEVDDAARWNRHDDAPAGDLAGPAARHLALALI
ncbi:MAG: hypothetical protein U0790_01975 [Isosphaeraceae bacterium]